MRVMRWAGGTLFRLISCLIIAQCSAVALTATFSGRVVHGQNFSKRLSADLWFCLFAEPDANGGGWLIAVQRTCTTRDHDFVSVATPPMYGVNPRMIEAWHFEPSANAPQKVRDFAFVLNEKDWQQLLADLNSYNDAGKMLAEIERLGRGHGTLTVRGMGRHLKDGAPIFDWMQFQVTLH